MYLALHDHPLFWVFVCGSTLLLAYLLKTGYLRRVTQVSEYNMIWLLPDEQRREAYVKDVLEFACKLRVCDAVTIGAFSYTVSRIELLIEDEWKLAVLLE